MKIKKQLTIILVMAVSAMVIAGCGSDKKAAPPKDIQQVSIEKTTGLIYKGQEESKVVVSALAAHRMAD